MRLKNGAMYYVEWDDTVIRNVKSDKQAKLFILQGDIPPGTTVGERIKVPSGMIRVIKRLQFVES